MIKNYCEKKSSSASRLHGICGIIQANCQYCNIQHRAKVIVNQAQYFPRCFIVRFISLARFTSYTFEDVYMYKPEPLQGKSFIKLRFTRKFKNIMIGKKAEQSPTGRRLTLKSIV